MSKIYTNNTFRGLKKYIRMKQHFYSNAMKGLFE